MYLLAAVIDQEGQPLITWYITTAALDYPHCAEKQNNEWGGPEYGNMWSSRVQDAHVFKEKDKTMVDVAHDSIILKSKWKLEWHKLDGCEWEGG
jgi:hypothetical protein